MRLITKLISLNYEKKQAQGLIMSGQVFVNQEKVVFPNFLVKAEDKIFIQEKEKWVSRGAYKLLEAQAKFAIDFKNKIVLDIGASTGGFSQVALHYGAQKVYTCDVGTNQLAYSLRSHPQTVVFEKTHFKNLELSFFKEKVDFVIADLSFISLKKLVAFLVTFFPYRSQFYFLFKPQFEAPKNLVKKGGFVPLSLHQQLLADFANYLKKWGLYISKQLQCQTKGLKSLNQEYFLEIKWKDNNVSSS